MNFSQILSGVKKPFAAKDKTPGILMGLVVISSLYFFLQSIIFMFIDNPWESRKFLEFLEDMSKFFGWVNKISVLLMSVYMILLYIKSKAPIFVSITALLIPAAFCVSGDNWYPTAFSVSGDTWYLISGVLLMIALLLPSLKKAKENRAYVLIAYAAYLITLIFSQYILPEITSEATENFCQALFYLIQAVEYLCIAVVVSMDTEACGGVASMVVKFFANLGSKPTQQ